MRIKPVFLLYLLLSLKVNAQQTQKLYLSGTGAEKTVDWEFYCSDGRNSGEWTTIAVPSCWEQEGFGSYNYGHADFSERLNETGTYRYHFSIPQEWKNKQISIVFDGVMTDAEVKINGKPAGPVHQGAFYQFRYNITGMVNTGKENELEVLVRKHSTNESVNYAERKADFWIFGGIYRPVYLEAKPEINIQRVAVDARADGKIKSNVYVTRPEKAGSLKMEIRELSGELVASFLNTGPEEMTVIQGKVENPKEWSPEYPFIYDAVFTLSDKKGKVIHTLKERIGFRTVEVKQSDGVYVNGVRIKMKGVNRHTFHPEFGRTSSRAMSIEDVKLMKDMNMNAVRSSHYPPDEHFLDVCDSLGLFVLDELTAWQKPSYDDTVGRKLLEEMIARDVNHPSIIFWDNGNEGGENNHLNDDFAELDIQQREVLHPWQDFGKTNTLHYINYDYLSTDGFSRKKIFFSTEFLHGLYDGGLGAGLEDFWLRMWNDPLCAGGFLWVFADEAIKRTDLNGKLDTDGNHAPDGILGPYHEKEGSYFTIKEIWAPVFFEEKYISPDFDGNFNITNRYHFTNLNTCDFIVEWINIDGAGENASRKTIHSEKLRMDLPPGKDGKLKINLPENWADVDILQLRAIDQYDHVINHWTWPVQPAAKKAEQLLANVEIEKQSLSLKETTGQIIVESADISFTFSKSDGKILKIDKGDKKIPLTGGPVFVSREKKIQDVSYTTDSDKCTIKASFENGDHFTWTVDNRGILCLNVAYEPMNQCLFAGISFDYPESNVKGMKWLGEGPYRVYKNRMKGVSFNLWEKDYNNTITGDSAYIYPEFKGYHSNVYWAKLTGKGDPGFTVYIHSDDIFLRMLTPKEPEEPARTKMQYPAGDISFLHGINAIGTKFKEAEQFGPQSSPYYFDSKKIHGGKLKMKLSFQF